MGYPIHGILYCDRVLRLLLYGGGTAVVDWKKWLGYNAYKKLWSLIGGRPWTYIMRDFAHQNPFLMLLIGFFFALVVKSYLRWDYLVVGSLCFLAAHLFWGTKYRKGQQGG